jgi:hypothetical protein
MPPFGARQLTRTGRNGGYAQRGETKRRGVSGVGPLGGRQLARINRLIRRTSQPAPRERHDLGIPPCEVPQTSVVE